MGLYEMPLPMSLLDFEMGTIPNIFGCCYFVVEC